MEKVFLCLTFIGMVGVTLQDFAMERQEDATPQAPVIVGLLNNKNAEELAIKNMDQLIKEIGWFNDSNTVVIRERFKFLVQHFAQWGSFFSDSTINKFYGVTITYELYMSNPPQPNVPQAPNPNLTGLNKRLF